MDVHFLGHPLRFCPSHPSAGIRTPVRVILDSRGRLPIDSQLVQTAAEVPVLLFTTDAADEEHLQQLTERGVEVIQTSRSSEGRHLCLTEVLQNLGQRQFTNVLLEAGSGIIGAFWDAEAIDEVHCFVGPKLIGGAGAMSPVGGLGLESMESAPQLIRPEIELLDEDVYIHSRLWPADKYFK